MNPFAPHWTNEHRIGDAVNLLSHESPRSIMEQFEDAGTWQYLSDFQLVEVGEKFAFLINDETFFEIGRTQIRGQKVILFSNSVFAIISPAGEIRCGKYV